VGIADGQRGCRGVGHGDGAGLVVAVEGIEGGADVGRAVADAECGEQEMYLNEYHAQLRIAPQNPKTLFSFLIKHNIKNMISEDYNDNLNQHQNSNHHYTSTLSYRTTNLNPKDKLEEIASVSKVFFQNWSTEIKVINRSLSSSSSMKILSQEIFKGRYQLSELEGKMQKTRKKVQT
jgi:hypothetical protein